MLVKVNNDFCNDPRVFLAADDLGRRGGGRVVAIWLEMVCWTIRNGTDGFIPRAVVAALKHDRRPLDVVRAMARSHVFGSKTWLGLLEARPGGYQILDCPKSELPGARHSLQHLLPELIARWGKACVYCGDEALPLEVEHLRPVSRGGADALTNLAPSCGPCNRRKGTRTAAEFGFPQLESIAAGTC